MECKCRQSWLFLVEQPVLLVAQFEVFYLPESIKNPLLGFILLTFLYLCYLTANYPIMDLNLREYVADTI
jgi:hypothetical protein